MRSPPEAPAALVHGRPEADRFAPRLCLRGQAQPSALTPQGGAASGPAKPAPRRPLGRRALRQAELPLAVLRQAVLALAVGAALPALAQYKVVGPDGRVTYTDRPVAPPAGGQVQPMRGGAAVPAPAARTPLPLELRAPAERFPATLYTSADCTPCGTGRALLQARGIPFSERLVATDEDIAALQRLTGGRTVPALTVGTQALRGFLDTDWQVTLDLAGYPKASLLPRGWSAGPATPLVSRAPAPTEPAAAPAPAAAMPPAAPPPSAQPGATAPAASGIRF